MLITFRRISSISAGSRGSGVMLLNRVGGVGGFVGSNTDGGGDNGCIISDNDNEGELTAINDGEQML